MEVLRTGDVLEILDQEIGYQKFEARENCIKKEFPRRKKYKDLWVVGKLPFDNRNVIPRKWDAVDLNNFQEFIEINFNCRVYKNTIKDAMLCLKNRIQN